MAELPIDHESTSPSRAELSVDEHVVGVRAGDRAVLARTITVIESTRPEDAAKSQEILARLLPHTGDAHRVGITGVPGVGKSTFIESLGAWLLEQGHKVAVLAIDPSSTISGGSILGDKTRMERLSADPRAFIRPSPSAGSLGGVARKTREAALVCEAAGYDIVLIETVGVGQSEVLVAGMVDFFLALMLTGAGDELQGIKRGLLELADMVAINKADGENREPAQRAAAQYENALRYLHPRETTWRPPVVTCSALNGQGLPELWTRIREHRRTLQDAGEWDAKRRRQLVRWMWGLVEDRMHSALKELPAVAQILEDTERAVEEGHLPPGLAAERILEAFATNFRPSELGGGGVD